MHQVPRFVIDPLTGLMQRRRDPAVAVQALVALVDRSDARLQTGGHPLVAP